MPDIKSIKSKIWSTKSLKKITNALEVISTIKLQKAKKQTEHLKKYMNEMIDLIHTLEAADWFLDQHAENNGSHSVLDIIISTNKWLCWSINSSLFKYLKQEIWLSNTHNVIVVWKKWIDRCIKNQIEPSQAYIIWDDVKKEEYELLVETIKTSMLCKTYRTIRIHHQYFINTLKQKPVSFQLYPFTKASFELFAQMIGLQFHDHGHIPSVQVKIEPNKKELVNKIRDMLIYHVIYTAILHSKTWEFAARMIAMKWAKDNAHQIISDLTLAYNKARQDAITKEVLEIVSAKSVIED